MVAGMLVTIREGTEAFLVVGILLGYLAKTKQLRNARYVWSGAASAVALSALLAVLFRSLAVEFEGAAEEWFEAGVSLAAVAVLSYMVLWMQRQSRGLRSELQQKVDLAISRNELTALAGLAFVSVLREGLETALFLTALGSTAPGSPGIATSPLFGALLGLAIAAAIVYLVFRTATRLDLRKFFVLTGWFIIVIAAGLVGHALMSLGELGIVPPIVGRVWDTGRVVSEDGLAGRLLHAFVGYVAAPSLTWAIGYFGYILAFGGMFARAVRAPSAAARARLGCR